MFQIIKPGTNFNIVAKQKYTAIFSAILVIASFVVLAVIGLNYGIDFKGGSDIVVSFTKTVDSQQVRDAAVKAGFDDASVQLFGPAEKNQFLIQTRLVSVMNKEKIEQVQAAITPLSAIEREAWSEEQPDRYDLTLATQVEPSALVSAIEAGASLRKVEVEQVGTPDERKYTVRFEDLQSFVREGFATALPDAFNTERGLDRLETVGARVGGQLREDGLTAFLLAILAILVYIAVRFDIRYAPGAVLALVHDVIITMGVLTLLEMEINLPILASVLTIVGYSLNDTIVIFDRIRENYTLGRGGRNLVEIVNTSVNETLSRTLMTSLTTLIAVAIIAYVGSGLIQNFALTLIIGIIVGTYSSIFIASPVLIVMDAWLKTRQEARELTRSQTSVEGA